MLAPLSGAPAIATPWCPAAIATPWCPAAIALQQPGLPSPDSTVAATELTHTNPYNSPLVRVRK